MIGIFLTSIIGVFEKTSIYFLTKDKNNQSIKIVLNYIIMTLLFFSISLIKYEKLDFSFIYDIKFYITMFLENLIIYISLKNYNKQKNFSQIAFAAFSSIYLIIILSYIYNKIFNLNGIISTPYNSIEEVIGYSLFFALLTIIYFFDKIKAKDIKYPFLLLIYSIILVNTLYFSITLIKLYQSFLVYSFLFITLSIHFYFQKINECKETITIKKIKTKNTFLYILSYFFTFILSIMAGNLIPVEFFAIFKRIGSIIGAVFIDIFLLNKKKVMNKKDVIVIILIIISSLYLYLSKI